MSAADLAKKIGYRSLNRCMRWIHDFEREGKFFTELLENITEALELDKRYVDQLIEKDKEQQKREFEGWVNVPIKWHLIVRFMPVVHGERDIPGHIKTEEEALDYANPMARGEKCFSV